MKNSLTGFLCLGLIWMAGAPAIRGQEVSDAPADQAAPQQQTPPQPAPPAAPAPQDTPPPETPGTPGHGIRRLPPPPPKVVDVLMPGESGWSIGGMDWIPIGKPWVDKGHGATFTGLTKLQYAGTPKYAPGGEFGIAAGAHNTIKVSYFQFKANGLSTAPNDLVVYSQAYTKGTAISTDYKIQAAKVSFEYLTWPYPVESRHFRLKTLWQVQVVNIKTNFDAPLAPTTDSNGNALTYFTNGSRTLISPTFGLGFTEYATRNFRFEVSASGFAIPHHFTIWDTEASVAYRIGHIEIRGGGKALHFKTSNQSDYFQYATLGGAFVGLRWYSD